MRTSSRKQRAAKQILKFTNHEFPKSKGPKPPFSQACFAIYLRIISRPNGSTFKKSGGWPDFWVGFRLTPAPLNTVIPHVIIIGGGDKGQYYLKHRQCLFATYGYKR